MGTSSRKTWGLLFAVALAVRLISLGELSGTPLFQYLLGDGIAYDAWARRIAAGDWIGSEVFYQAPFYPYALGVVYSVLDPNPLWVRILQTILGATSCVLLALAGRRFFGEREGLAAGFLLALYPPAIFFDGEIQKASFDLFFSAVVLLLVARIWSAAAELPLSKAAAPPPHSKQFRDALALGVVAGLFALNRENALLLLPLLGGWLLVRRRFALAALFLAGAFAMLLPVALRNRAVGGELLLTTSQLGTNFYIGNHEGADGRYQPLRAGRGSAQYEREDATALAQAAAGRELSPAEVSRYWLGRALAFVREQPGRWSALLARKWFLLWNRREIVDTTSLETAADFSHLLRWLGYVLHFGVLCPIAIAGMWLTRRRWRELAILYAMLIAWALSVVAFYVLARYRYPIVPILALFAGAAIIEWFRVKRLAPIALALLAAIFVNWPLGDRDPRAPTYANLGNAIAETGDLRGGIRMLERAVALSPGFAEAHLALGHLQYQAGDVEAAETSYRRALALDLPSAAAWNNLGMIEARRGNRAEALQMFERAVAIDGHHVFALHNLARFRFEAGDHSAALDLYTRLVQIDDRDAEAHHQLANLYAFRGDFAAARQQYERALALDDRRADAHFKLGILLERLGEREAGERHIARAIELVPAYAERLNRLRASSRSTPPGSPPR